MKWQKLKEFVQGDEVHEEESVSTLKRHANKKTTALVLRLDCMILF